MTKFGPQKALLTALALAITQSSLTAQSVWRDVILPLDGVRDEILPVGTGFTYSISDWSTDNYGYAGYPINDFWFDWNVSWGGGDYSDDFTWAWLNDPYWLTPNSYTYAEFQVTFEVETGAYEPFTIYKDTSTSEAVNPGSWGWGVVGTPWGYSSPGTTFHSYYEHDPTSLPFSKFFMVKKGGKGTASGVRIIDSAAERQKVLDAIASKLTFVIDANVPDATAAANRVKNAIVDVILSETPFGNEVYNRIKNGDPIMMILKVGVNTQAGPVGAPDRSIQVDPTAPALVGEINYQQYDLPQNEIPSSHPRADAVVMGHELSHILFSSVDPWTSVRDASNNIIGWNPLEPILLVPDAEGNHGSVMPHEDQIREAFGIPPRPSYHGNSTYPYGQ